jgi:ABC-type multidrug transport system ATPase subunit
MSKGLRLENFGCRVVEKVDMTVPAGHCLGLTGPSGSGKSLFLRALADLDPYEGRMSLDGVDAASLPAPRWRRQVGLLPAESAWWFDTVGEHFEQTPPRWLESLGFDDQVMNWQVNHLSSGERQRLALLRVLVMQPKVLLLDEPTANLDPQNTVRVETLLNRVRLESRPAVVWVSHDMEQLKRWCNPIRILDGRRLNRLDPPRGEQDRRKEVPAP